MSMVDYGVNTNVFNGMSLRGVPSRLWRETTKQSLDIVSPLSVVRNSEVKSFSAFAIESWKASGISPPFG
jgi:hypothetical protein